MFAALTAAGIPLGPLDQDRPVWRTASGSGKHHLDSLCRPGLRSEQRTLRSLRDRDVCSKCNTKLSNDERTWRDTANQLLTWRSQAFEIVSMLTHLARTKVDPTSPWTSLAKFVARDLRFTHPFPEDLDELRELYEWGLQHVAGLNRCAVARLRGLENHESVEEWNIRWAAVQTVDGINPATYELRDGSYPALGFIAGLPVAQGNALSSVTWAVKQGLRRGDDEDACRAAAASAGKSAMASEKTPRRPEQVTDAALASAGIDPRDRHLLGPSTLAEIWQRAVADEVDQLARFVARTGFADLEMHRSSPTAAFVFLIEHGCTPSDLAVLAAVQAPLREYRFNGQEMLCYLPASLAGNFTGAGGNANLIGTFGAVRPGDTVDLFLTAASLAESLEQDGPYTPELADMARALLVPTPAA